MRFLGPRRSQIKCCSDGFEQQVMIHRFRQELDSALSHRLNPHPGASIAYKQMIGISHCFALSLPAVPNPRSPAFAFQLSDTRLHGANRIQGIVPPIQSTEPQSQ
jgi:hypothetical protein